MIFHEEDSQLHIEQQKFQWHVFNQAFFTSIQAEKFAGLKHNLIDPLILSTTY